MKWVDVEDIAIALEEAHGDSDILGLRFTDLRAKIMGLEGFDDAPERCNERVLEAIQMAWLEERNS